MASEYIRLSPEEKIYGQSIFLNSQLSFIDIINKIKGYKKLRKKELQLKISLKSKISEIYISLEEFSSYLPKSEYNLPPIIKPKVKNIDSKEEFELKDEIEDIKRKLHDLEKEI